ncbi:MAG: carboxypeptidase-like regulatory domain-containing protein [Halobacteriota archaeon]
MSSSTECVVLKLSLAICLVDGYSKNSGVQGEISLKECDIQPHRNLSGYYVFEDLPTKMYTVKAHASDVFLDAEAKADLTADAPVVINIELTPAPSYPFPASATLIRGTVKDGQGVGIPDALVTVQHDAFAVPTTGQGEFVIFFNDPHKVVKVAGKRLVKIAGDDPVIQVDHQSYGTHTKKQSVEEGTAVSLSIDYP